VDAAAGHSAACLRQSGFGQELFNGLGSGQGLYQQTLKPLSVEILTTRAALTRNTTPRAKEPAEGPSAKPALMGYPAIPTARQAREDPALPIFTNLPRKR
jgi:hypothetical protein